MTMPDRDPTICCRSGNDAGDGGTCTHCGRLHAPVTITSEPPGLKEPPWGPQPGGLDEDRTCVRCGGLVAAGWRHFWPPCPNGCSVADPVHDCPLCAKTGFLPCVPQDLNVLRASGLCKRCGEPAYRLHHRVDGWVEGSDRHYEARLDEDHPAEQGPGPLVRVLGDFLDRAATP